MESCTEILNAKSDSHVTGFPQWVCLQTLSEGPLWQTATVCANTDLDKEMALVDTHLEDSPKDSKYFGK